MGLRTRGDFFDLNTGIDTQQIYRASRMVSNLTGLVVQPNKAIVGANAFRHQSGIHQHGVLKLRETYEIIDARTIGLPRGAELVLNKNSGRHGLQARLEELGYQVPEEEMGRLFLAFKELADKKGEIDDRDLESLVADKIHSVPETYRLDLVSVTCGDHTVPTATVRLIGPDGQVLADAALGDGPVDAVCKAIDRLVRVPNRLVEFAVKNVTEGLESVGEVTIRIEQDDHVQAGRGADTDIVVASAKAYLNALNRLLSHQQAQQQELEPARTP